IRMASQDRKAMTMKWKTAIVFALIAIAGLLTIALNAPLTRSEGAPKLEPAFVDPTATVSANVHMGHLVFVAPFAEIKTGATPDKAVNIGNETNIQDNCVVAAEAGAVKLGDLVIIAHGAKVKGPASIGATGRCPQGESCPSFVGFNAEVDGAIIEKDAGVSALARVGPGVTIPSGYMVLPGKNVTSNAEVKAKTTPMTPDDRAFMKSVLEVNIAFARQYAALDRQAP